MALYCKHGSSPQAGVFRAGLTFKSKDLRIWNINKVCDCLQSLSDSLFCEKRLAVPFLTLGCFPPFHPILSFFFTPLPLLISLCFTARKSKSPYDSVSKSHFASNVSCLRPTAADSFDTQPAVNEFLTTFRISLNAEWTTVSAGMKKGPCSEKVLGLIPGISV